MQVEKKYHADPNYSHALCCGPGGKDHSSIDAKLNGAYILMGLLYGNGDPDKTITIACRCGQDSDCNPSNAAGILFTMLGASKIPAKFTEKLDRGARFSHSGYTLLNVYEVSEKLARLGIAKAGGRIENSAEGGEQFVIPVQTPKPSQLASSKNPGPSDDVRYSAEEMARIKGGKPANAALAADEKAKDPSKVPVSLIFDTDIGNDIDDALALGLIHSLESLGECKLLAVTVTKDNRYAAPFVDLVNTFYGRGHIPIGVVRKGVTPDDGNFNRELATAEDNGQPRYPHKLRDGRDAPEATGLLRKVLAGQPDGSVVIVQVGFSTNLAKLLDSKADDISPLDGAALVKKKVRLLSAMAGRFTPMPNGTRFTEYNVVMDVKSAQHVVEQWPTPMVLSGFEVGEVILYPGRSIEQDYGYVKHHPIAEAYPLLDRNSKMPYDRPAWDLTSVLYAVRPDAGYFGLSPQGRATVEKDGATVFQADPSGPHRFLTVNQEQIARVCDVFVKLCCRRPDPK
jgi:inosine-uridine nucleoside N-ribohydrolase